METSAVSWLTMLVGCMVAGPPPNTDQSRRKSQATWSQTIVVLGLMTLLALRVDTLLVGIPVLVYLYHEGHRKMVYFSVGGLSLVSAALILHFGSFLPDTAVAKSTPMELGWILSAIRALASINPAWFLAPIAGLTLAWGMHGQKKLFALAMAPLLLQLVAGFGRGQIIHGARYFLWPLSFCFGTLAVAIFSRRNLGLKPALLNAFIVVCIGHFLLSCWYFRRIIERPFQDFSKIESGKIIAAEDIGQVGWFTQASIVDISALVNGRVVAELQGEARLAAGIKSVGRPDYFFMRSDTYASLYPVLAHWGYKLEDEGLCTSVWNLSTKVDHRLYKVTNGPALPALPR